VTKKSHICIYKGPWPLSVAIMFHTHIPICSLGEHQLYFYFVSRESTLGEELCDHHKNQWPNGACRTSTWITRSGRQWVYVGRVAVGNSGRDLKIVAKFIQTPMHVMLLIDVQHFTGSLPSHRIITFPRCHISLSQYMTKQRRP
jgi:hypothetical protein